MVRGIPDLNRRLRIAFAYNPQLRFYYVRRFARCHFAGPACAFLNFGRVHQTCRPCYFLLLSSLLFARLDTFYEAKRKSLTYQLRNQQLDIGC